MQAFGKEAAVYQREVARYRVEDMVRQAETYRLSRSSRAERRAKRRRVAGSAAALVAWPFKR